MDTVGLIRWDYADANTDLGTNDIKSIAGAGLIVGVVVELLIIGDDCWLELEFGLSSVIIMVVVVVRGGEELKRHEGLWEKQ